jgi:hypothetical protein
MRCLIICIIKCNYLKDKKSHICNTHGINDKYISILLQSLKSHVKDTASLLLSSSYQMLKVMQKSVMDEIFDTWWLQCEKNKMIQIPGDCSARRTIWYIYLVIAVREEQYDTDTWWLQCEKNNMIQIPGDCSARRTTWYRYLVIAVWEEQHDTVSCSMRGRRFLHLLCDNAIWPMAPQHSVSYGNVTLHIESVGITLQTAIQANSPVGHAMFAFSYVLCIHKNFDCNPCSWWTTW